MLRALLAEEIKPPFLHPSGPCGSADLVGEVEHRVVRREYRHRSYTKALPHYAHGVVSLNAFATFEPALNSGKFSDFERIIMGDTRTLNGPQGGMCFVLDVPDSVQFGQPQVPPAPEVAAIGTPPNCWNITGRRCCATCLLPAMVERGCRTGRRRARRAAYLSWPRGTAKAR
jgi:hypothetical protein